MMSEENWLWVCLAFGLLEDEEDEETEKEEDD